MSSDSVTASVAPPPLITIKPRRSWLPASPKELWSFRELTVRFAARDITLRYRQTALGVIWVILVPLLAAGILTFVFGGVADLPSPSPDVPYYVFTLAGMVAWTAFSQVTNRASGSLVGNAQLVGKVYFPRLLLPISTVLSTMVDAVVSLALLLVLLGVTGVRPGLGFITFPLWFLMVVALGLGIGLAAGALMVRYRDISYILPVAVQFLLFASPVAYTLADVPADAQWLIELNPLTGLLEGMRWSLIGTPRPSAALAAYAIGVSLLVLAVGTVIFSRMERQFADVI
ncbi:MAG: ABC transporter permease [Acidimicrobiales bacterium]|nr:ABC transporter permease [Acidimicrobiales bacterium]